MNIRRADLPQIALELRRLGELLITPCPCGSTEYTWLKAHMLSEHIWDATLDMAPGPKAQAFEPRTIAPLLVNGAPATPAEKAVIDAAEDWYVDQRTGDSMALAARVAKLLAERNQNDG